uniref:Uncharacterized protein n=1 Tax=Rousettus aegyptiacus TaxID=9407 RepID=A0A7J8CI24_ROUAE|nr:hypothetical protein HJG63_008981 [Rousettus aegyptiacus]
MSIPCPIPRVQLTNTSVKGKPTRLQAAGSLPALQLPGPGSCCDPLPQQPRSAAQPSKPCYDWRRQASIATTRQQYYLVGENLVFRNSSDTVSPQRYLSQLFQGASCIISFVFSCWCEGSHFYRNF